MSVLRRHCDRVGLAETLPHAFVIGKKESTILDNWSSGGCAELVSFEGRDDQIPGRILRRVKEIARVELAVPNEFVGRSVKRIRTGAGRRIDYPSGSFSIVGWRVARHHRKLLHCIHPKYSTCNTSRRS